MCKGLKTQDVEYIAKVCSDHQNDSGELINVLHKVQQHFGYLPPVVQECIASCMNIPVSKVYGVVTFYSLFTMIPKGRNPISVCTGTACYVRGVEAVVDEFERQLGIKVGETTADGNFSLNCLRCVGACGLAPVAMVGDKIYGHMTVEDVKNILDEYRT